MRTNIQSLSLSLSPFARTRACIPGQARIVHTQNELYRIEYQPIGSRGCLLFLAGSQSGRARAIPFYNITSFHESTPIRASEESLRYFVSTVQAVSTLSRYGTRSGNGGRRFVYGRGKVLGRGCLGMWNMEFGKVEQNGTLRRRGV